MSLSLDNEFVRTERRAPYGWGAGDAALQNLSPGTYRLTAVAEDNDGLTSTANATITIVGETIDDNTPPDDTPPDDNTPNPNVFSLAGLREEIQQSNRTIVMQSGNYNFSRIAFEF